ncbi:MAG: MFS transporter [Candidatus Lokiarchaeota archaeon]|nr:MFS transporter [Candidatus Lokiarchaeota archaeon]
MLWTRARVVLLGIAIFLTVTSTAVLHANQYEFIVMRFPDVGIAGSSLYDTMLYSAYLVVGFSTGVLQHKTGHRRAFLVIGGGGASVCFLVLPALQSFPVLLCFRFLQGSFTVMAWQAISTMVLDLSCAEDRGVNLGIFGIFLGSGMGVGSMLGGAMAEAGLAVPYYFASGFSAGVFLVGMLGVRGVRACAARPRLRDSLSVLRRHPRLAAPAVFNFVDRLHMGFIVFMVPMLLATLGLDEGLRGMLIGIQTIPMLLMQYPVGKWSDRHGRLRPLVVGSTCYGTTLILLGGLFSTSFPAIAVGMVVLGVFSGLTTAPANALVGDVIPHEANAMGMASFNLAGNIGIVVGPLLGGFVAGYFGFGAAFMIAGLIELVSLAVNLVVLRDIHEATSLCMTSISC